MSGVWNSLEVEDRDDFPQTVTSYIFLHDNGLNYFQKKKVIRRLQSFGVDQVIIKDGLWFQINKEIHRTNSLKLKNIFSGIYDPHYSLPITEQKLCFILGPPLHQQQTTRSWDLCHLLEKIPVFTRDDRQGFLKLLRIENFHAIIIKIKESDDIEEIQLNLEAILCHTGCDMIQYPLSWFSQHNVPTRKPTEIQYMDPIPKIKWDPLEAIISGFPARPGLKAQYMALAPRAMVALVRNIRYGKVAYRINFDYWVPYMRLSSRILLDPGRIVSEGLFYTSGTLSNYSTQMSLFTNNTNQWFAQKILATQMGIIMIDGFPNKITPDMENVQLIDSYIKSNIGTGYPIPQGFLQTWPIESQDKIPSHCCYSGLICAAENLPKHWTGHETQDSDVIYIYQFGYWRPEAYLEKRPNSRHDSGIDHGCLSRAIFFFLQNIGADKVRALSASSCLETVYGKLTSIRTGLPGLKLSANALPEDIKSGLLPLTNKNWIINHRFLTVSFLNSIAPITFLALSAPLTPGIQALIKATTEAWNCPITLIGLQTTDSGVFLVDDLPPRQTGNLYMIKRLRHHFPLVKDKKQENFTAVISPIRELDPERITNLLFTVLEHPSIGSKEHILMFMDRISNGRIARQQMVGPRMLPVADYATVISQWPIHDDQANHIWGTAEKLSSLPKQYHEHPVSGISSALGVETLLATETDDTVIINAIIESLFNLLMADFDHWEDIILKACIIWPNSRQSFAELRALLDSSHSFCLSLGVSFSVDSCKSSTLAAGTEDCSQKTVVVTSSVPSTSVSKSLTPEIQTTKSILIHVSLPPSWPCKHKICKQILNISPGPRDGTFPVTSLPIYRILQAITDLKRNGLILSGHDVGEGGVWTTLTEMALCGNSSLKIKIPFREEPLEYLLRETPGILIEVLSKDIYTCNQILQTHKVLFWTVGTTECCDQISPSVSIEHQEVEFASFKLEELHAAWIHYCRVQLPTLVPFDFTLIKMNQQFEVRLPSLSYTIPLGLYKYHTVKVYMLPGAPEPESLLAALCEAGFNPLLVNLGSNKTVKSKKLQTVTEDTSTVFGFCVVGSNFMDPDYGDEGVLAWMKSRTDFMKELRILIGQTNIFSIALGGAACQLMSELRCYGYHGLTNTHITCNPTLSRRFETRWLPIYIPRNTKAIAFKSLRNCIIPCWVQGTHLGFYHASKSYLNLLGQYGQIASRYHGPTLTGGPAHSYPFNPTGDMFSDMPQPSIAGLCSADGRHLGLLHDPTLCNYLWQWPHIPRSNIQLSVSPWKRMFIDLHLWANQTAAEPPRRRGDVLRNVQLHDI
ncbi:v-FGAM-synthase [Saguinine gammaherpesvirus 1]|uniref:V-FGAM-synthase n=1 Tax=Saguinine gammaherpesvirus 1 TaxID=2169901 RepID=A0A9Q8QWY1_9GAMA|nr:v-FGAM-synthase [Saguinine gammaherpesvirus 1]